MMKTWAIGVVAMMMSINLAMAANYTVGGANGGWDQATDLATWAASQTFVVGDFLFFQYTLNHDVTELSEADFGPCSLSSPLRPPRTGGNTVIPLTSAGSRYFTCTTGGHCLGGMKVQIDTVAPPPSTTPSPPPATTPTVPSPPPKASASPPPKTSPPSKTAPSNPAPPPSPTPPTGSLPPPAPSSAAKSGVMGAVIASSGLALMIMFLNI